MEKYDFEMMNNSKVNPLAIMRNGWTIVMYKMSEIGNAYYREYPPTTEFYVVGKMFYPNGKLKAKGKITGRFLNIGLWQYFDEDGKLIEEIDEDKKFGKIKLDWLLKFIEKEGHINLSTGEGREYAVIEENGSGMIYPCKFILWLNEDNLSWVITITPDRKNEFHRTTYHIDKDSGEVLFKESEQIQYIK